MLHILPINDIIEHVKCSTCNCQPKVEVLENGDLLVVHNAIDGRK